MKRTLAIWLSLCLLVSAFTGLGTSVSAADNTPPSAPDGLMMELSQTPLGIESATPELSWVVNDPDKDEIQTAYQILVATSEEKLTETQADVWNSGKVTSRENSNVPYEGPAIPADGIYYWTVRTWDKEDASSPFAEPQFFSTAVKHNWQASAIWSGKSDDTASVSGIFEQAGLTDYNYEMDFEITDVAMGFSFRKMTNNATEEKMYMWQIRAETGSSPAILRPHIANGPNAFTTIGDVDLSKAGISIKEGETHHLKISCVGNKIETFIDDILVATHERTEYAAGTFGLRCGNSESGTVDNLKVSKPDGTVLYENNFDSGRNPFTGGGSIEEGRLKVGNGNKLYYVLSSTMTALVDYGMECDFTVDDVALGFSVRKQQNTSTENYCYMFQIRVNAGSTPAQLKPHIVKSSTNEVSGKGDTVNLDTLGIDILPGEQHHLKILAVGAKIEVWIDGILCLTMDDATEYPAGNFGIRCGNSESGTVDNLKITDALGTPIYENDFESGENPFPNGGTVANGVLKINKGEKLYYVSKTEELPEKGNIVFLRDEFSIQKPVKKALVSAIGKSRDKIKQYNFKLYLNGACVGLGSPRSINDGVYTNVYSTFDVTDYLREGDNAIGAICYAVSDKRFQMQMKVFYEDGAAETFVTDDGWKSLDGTAIYGDDGSTIGGNGAYSAMADNIDARLFPYGWSEPGFDDSGWDNVSVKETITDLTASPIENMFEYVMPVQSVVDKGDGNYFITLEKEIIGGFRLKLPDGVDGAKITMLYGEQLSAPNTVKWQMNTGNTYREYWTLKDGEQMIENFGMKGFRYIEIQNCPVEITKDMVEGVAYRQAFDDDDASFSSSSQILNDIFDLVQYSMKATNQDIYTDSQTRERADNNSGDVYINAKTSHAVSRNYTLAWYTTHYMDTLRYQISEYNIHAILTAWEMYQYTGNKAIIEQDYNHFIDLLRLDHYNEETGLFWFQTDTTFRDLVDWPDSERDGYHIYDCYYNTVVNSYQYKGMMTVADIAEVLGKTADAEKYRAMAAELKQTINDTFFNVNGDGLYIEGMKQDGTLVTGTATPATLYPLLHGLLDDPDDFNRALQHVADKGFTGSVFGAQFLLELLYDTDMGSRSLELLTDTGLRSWAHMMYDLGATITTEAWDPSRKPNMTFSHPWGSAAGNAMVEGLCGVTPLTPGYETIQIRPQLGTLESVELKTPTIKGDVKVKAVTNNPRYAVQLTTDIPANTTATVYVPLYGSGLNFALVDGVATEAICEGDYLVFENVGSGEHTFEVPAGVKLNLSLADKAPFYTLGSTESILSATDSEGNPVSLENANITYTSSSDAAKVDAQTGVVTFAAPGKATITATAVFTDVEVMGITIPSLTVSTSMDIEVVDPKIVKMQLKIEPETLYPGCTAQAILQQVKEDGSIVDYTPDQIDSFASSNPDIASVDALGNITVHQAGEFSITAKTSDGLDQASGELDGSCLTSTPIFEDHFDNNANFPSLSAKEGILTVDKGQNANYAGGYDWTDYVVETRAKADENAFSLRFRVGENGQHYLWQINEKDGNVLKMHDFNADGTNGNIGSVQLGDEYRPGEYNDLKVVASGSTITTYVNGVQVSQIENNRFSSGSVGFRNGGSEVCSYDYLRVSKLQLTASASLTAESGVSAYLTDVDGETAIDSVVANQDMLIHVTTPATIDNLHLYNEYGLRISYRLAGCTEQNGQKQWTIQTRLGTVGQNRTITVVPMDPNGELNNCSVDLSLSVLASDPVLHSAAFTEPTGIVNKPITLEALTSPDVVRIELYNETGLKIGVLGSTFTPNADGTLTWTVSTKIGTAGNRVVTIRAVTKYGTSDSVTVPVQLTYF